MLGQKKSLRNKKNYHILKMHTLLHEFCSTVHTKRPYHVYLLSTIIYTNPVRLHSTRHGQFERFFKADSDYV